jgi:hypothetical protein
MTNQVSQGSQDAAADALAMFAEEETETIIEAKSEQHVETIIETRVNSGGIELPQKIKSQVSLQVSEKVVDDTRAINCPTCQFGFKIRVPKGVSEAVVACPSCNSDFGLEFA